jgi:hypothetical protein
LTLSNKKTSADETFYTYSPAVLLLTGCWKSPSRFFQMSVNKRTNKAIGLVKEEKKAAVQLIDTTIKLYPEFAHRTETVKRDTIIVPKVEFQTVFKDHPVVDSVAISKLVARQLSDLDSLKFALADRDRLNRILTRQAMAFLNEDGLINKDTLVTDTLGIRLKVFIVKNNIIAEVRQSENRIPCPDAITSQTDIKPAYIKDWWAFRETWIACGLILIFLSGCLVLTYTTIFK